MEITELLAVTSKARFKSELLVIAESLSSIDSP